MDLAEKVYEQTVSDTGLTHAVPDELPSEARGNEAYGDAVELRWYSAMFGLAWGIARAENPFASDECVAGLAKAAADTAHRRMTEGSGAWWIERLENNCG